MDWGQVGAMALFDDNYGKDLSNATLWIEASEADRDSGGGGGYRSGGGCTDSGCFILLALFAVAPGPWPLICVAAIAYGMIYGEQTVFCPIVTRQFYGMRSYGELYSTVSTVICIGVIASSFIGGTIVNVAGSYLAMFAFIGAALLVACLLLVVAVKLRAKG